MRAPARRRVIATLAAFVAGVCGLSVAYASDAPSLAQIDGKLLVAHGISDSGGMVMQARVRTSHGDVALAVSDKGHAQLMSLAGREVRVRGQKQGATFAAASLAAVDSAAAARPPITAMKTAVILMHDGTKQTEDVPPAQAESTMFSGPSSVAKFYSLVSGGKATMTGKVFGYYDRPKGVQPCDLSSMQNAAQTAAAADGFRVSDYNYVVVSSPRKCSGFIGVGWVGASGVLIANAFSQGVIEHEMGHNLGAWHGGFASCAGCAVTTYGDPTDVMGSGGSGAGYGGYHLDLFGWLPPAQVKTQTSGTQTYTLAPIDDPTLPGTQLVYVPRGDGTQFTVERRQILVGNNTWIQNQISLKVVERDGTNDVVYLRSLYANQPWVDSAKNITFLALDDQTVKVCFGACGANPPGSTTTTSSSTTTSTTVPRTTSTTTTTVPGTAPKVTISAPLAGAHITGNIRVLATAPGATRVELWVDGRKLGSHEGGTFSRQWTASSSSVKPGPHTITVKAYGKTGPPGAQTINVVK